jgi:hypothetical protein
MPLKSGNLQFKTKQRALKLKIDFNNDSLSNKNNPKTMVKYKRVINKRVNN